MSRLVSGMSFIVACLFVSFVAPNGHAKLVLRFDMEQSSSPLLDVAGGRTAEEVDDGHLYGLPGPDGFGKAIGLEDNGSWQLDVDESELFREFANDFSVAGWIYLDSDILDQKFELGETNATLNRFFGDDVAWDADGWGMGVFEDGRVRFTKNGVVDLDTADSWVEPDEWYHLAATVSSADGVTIYVNGEEAQLFDDTRDLNNGLGNNGQDDVYGVGRTYGNGEGQWVAGRMDDIRVYDHVLSAEEVAQLLTPDAGVPGDFDGDGQLTAADIDLLSAAAIAMTNDKAFDLNRDDIVDGKDRLVWVNDLRQTYFGDANLDGVFNTTDLIDVFQAGKFETGNSASWSEGDWSGDGLFGTSDLILAFQDGGFEQGPKAAQAVPEPASAFLAIIGALAIGVVCRRSDR